MASMAKQETTNLNVRVAEDLKIRAHRAVLGMRPPKMQFWITPFVEAGIEAFLAGVPVGRVRNLTGDPTPAPRTSPVAPRRKERTVRQGSDA